jgi:hypothetical protein
MMYNYCSTLYLSQADDPPMSGVEDDQQFSVARPPSPLFRRLRILAFLSFVLGCAYWLLVPLDPFRYLPGQLATPKSEPEDGVYALNRGAFNKLLPQSDEAGAKPTLVRQAILTTGFRP